MREAVHHLYAYNHGIYYIYYTRIALMCNMYTSVRLREGGGMGAVTGL